MPSKIDDLIDNPPAIVGNEEESLSAPTKQYKEEFELKEYKETHELRKIYCNRIFWLIVAWLFIIQSILFCSGFQLMAGLSSSVLITITTTTTISVLGLFIIVAKWLFPKN